MARLKYGLLMSVMLLMSGLAYALDDSKGNSDKCFLWEVRSKTATVYLLGLFHMFKKEMYPLDKCISAAFDKADTLVVEVNMNTIDQNRTASLFKERGIYPEDTTLEQRLSKETLEKLKKYLTRIGADITQVNKMRPWYLGMTIAVQEMIALGYDPDLGIDLFFLANAGARNILELETIEDQMDILAGDPDEVQDIALRMALEDLSDLEMLMDKMVNAWTKGDAQALNDIMREPADRYPLLEQQIKRTIDDRNVDMAGKISGFLKTGKTYFVIVGGGHIGGKKGLAALLKARGYTVNQMPKQAEKVSDNRGMTGSSRIASVALSR